MATSYSTGLVNAWLENKGFAEILANGVIEIYSGTRPVNADAAIPDPTKLLGTVTKNGGAFTPGVATNGLNFGTPTDKTIDKSPEEVWMFTAIKSGTATWFRHKGNATDGGASSTTLPRIDGSISAFGGDAVLSETVLVEGNVYTQSRCRFTFPA